ncbi:MAG: putative Ig domain-containing protein [Bdellovibrionales bacterium]|nr:putative Ig domain-containing protein [Bdellovibrionales bacterium]
MKKGLFSVLLFASLSFSSFASENAGLSYEIDPGLGGVSSASEPSKISNLQDLRKQTERKWKFKCESQFGKDPELEKAFREFFTETLFHGANQLKDHNPAMMGSLSWMAKKKLRVSCIDDIDTDANARAQSDWLIRNQITAEAIVPNLVCHLSKNKDVQAKCAEKKIKPTSRNIEAMRATIFHESLHIMGFDTLSTEAHNKGGPSEVDAVYACAYMVWPNGLGSREVKKEDLPPSGLYYQQRRWDLSLNQPVVIAQPLSTGGFMDLFSVNAKLPAGLELDMRTGEISGTPTEVFPKTEFLVTGQSTLGTTTTKLTLTVTDPGPVVIASPAPSPSPTVSPSPTASPGPRKIFGRVREYYITEQSCKTCALVRPIHSKIKRNFADARLDTLTGAVRAAEESCKKVKPVAYDFIHNREIPRQ